MKKRVETVPAEAMKVLQHYSRLGNVRELENFVERAIFLTHGSGLYVSPTELKRAPSHSKNAGTPALEQTDRDHIFKVLSETHWIVGHTAGAAAKLRSNSKMQKLDISRRS